MEFSKQEYWNGLPFPTPVTETSLWLQKSMESKFKVFAVIMYGCKSCTIKRNECWRIDAFKLWCWRRLLWVPWTARRSTQSILKEISPEYSLEGLMPKLKLQYFGHLMWRADSLKRPWSWERLKAGGDGDGRGRDGWMASLTQWTWISASSVRWWRTGSLVCCSSWSCRVRHNWVTGEQHALCFFPLFSTCLSGYYLSSSSLIHFSFVIII